MIPVPPFPPKKNMGGGHLDQENPYQCLHLAKQLHFYSSLVTPGGISDRVQNTFSEL